MKTLIDLFCGAGCFSEGFKRAGFKVIAGVDIWPVAIESFNANNSGLGICSDIQALDFSKFERPDILIGSPPCIDWSEGKKNKRSFDKTLINCFLRAVEVLKPCLWIWECAKETKKGFDGIIVNAFNYGVPQNRLRCFHSNFKIPDYIFEGGNVNSALGWKETKVLFNHRSLNLNAYSPVYLSNRPARTVVTWPIRIYKEREFTVEEMKIIQSIPQNFVLCGSKAMQYKQIGNAVPPGQAFYIGVCARDELKK